MAKVKYYYDQESLSYRKIEVKNRRKVRNVLAFVAAAALFGVGFMLFLLSTPLLSTPTEISQARELDNYKLNYEQLQRKMTQVEEVLDHLQSVTIKFTGLFLRLIPYQKMFVKLALAVPTDIKT